MKNIYLYRRGYMLRYKNTRIKAIACLGMDEELVFDYEFTRVLHKDTIQKLKDGGDLGGAAEQEVIRNTLLKSNIPLSNEVIFDLAEGNRLFIRIVTGKH